MAVRIAVLCVATAVVCMTVRVNRPEIALATALAAGVAAALMSLDEIRAVARVISAITEGIGVEKKEISTALRAGGLALIGEYAAALCRDAGEGALAQRVEFAARVSLLALLAPLAAEVMGEIARVLP